ncbi:MAG: hypothetical protein WCK00_11540, partial [Deltaproteobacteria bacterium]
MTLGVPITGQLASTTDVDYYAVVVGSSGLLSVAFDGPISSSLDYFKVATYDSAGLLLAQWATGADKTWQVGVATAGTYYVSVADVGTYSLNSGQYSLTMSLTSGSAASAESEPNDSRAAADAVTLGVPITGQLASTTDVDYYAVVVGS